MDHFLTADHVATRCAPTQPVICHRPHAARRAASWFMDRFPGTVFYAVKANPDRTILDAISGAGVQHFDVASMAEICRINAQFPNATMGYLHPVKPRAAIAEAYFNYGIRIFSLDTEAELQKILEATEYAKDLTLLVRIQVDNSHASLPLARKFGAMSDVAVPLMQRTRQIAARLGICFHVGSQAMTPTAYANALDHAQQLVVRSGVIVDIVDVGGGFPAAYPGMTPPALQAFVDAIAPRFEEFLSTENSELWCEPGRALCAEAASLVVRVDGRRGQDLYINDGTYGMLYDAGHLDWAYPMRPVGRVGGASASFSLYGPTCDDADHLKGPFWLPSDIGEGDYIEIGMMGAYGRSMATGFNGFGEYVDVLCQDDPFGSVYEELPLGTLVASND